VKTAGGGTLSVTLIGEWATPDLEYVAYSEVINQFG
jgi:hypothetical protein